MVKIPFAFLDSDLGLITYFVEGISDKYPQCLLVDCDKPEINGGHPNRLMDIDVSEYSKNTYPPESASYYDWTNSRVTLTVSAKDLLEVRELYKHNDIEGLTFIKLKLS